MSFSLTDEHRALRQMVRDLGVRELAPIAQAVDEAGLFRRDLFQKLADLGLAGMGVPAAYGGAGTDYLSFALVMEELARYGLSFAGPLSVHTLCQVPLLMFGREDQKACWLPKMASGEALGAFCLTEPNAGSDTARLEAKAQPDGDDFVLDGQKVFITNGGEADLYFVYARTGGLGGKGLSAFLVEKGTPGLIFGKKEKTLGNRATGTRQVTLEGCRVPAANLLGEMGQGQKIALSALAKGRVSVAAGAVGAAQGVLETALSYAQTRVAFGKPISEHQAIQVMLGEMATLIEGARLLTYRAAQLIDQGTDALTAASMAKLYATDMGMKVASDGVQILGGYGYTEEYPVARALRDAKGAQIYEGTNQIQRLVIARSLIGR